MRRRALPAALLFCMLPAVAAAQNRDPARFRDSLQTVRDVPALFRMERSLEMPGAARTVGPILERGLIAQRIYEITADPEDAARARDAFKRATERFPAEPWSHYGYAMALAAGPEFRVQALGGMLSDITVLQSFAELRKADPRSRARASLRRVLNQDPAFTPAVVLLADLAVADGGRTRSLIVEARDAARSAIAAGATDPAAAAALGRMETALGNYSAAAAATAAAAVTGDASALRSNAEALLLQPGREADGYEVYARAIANLTPAAAAAMYEDVQVLLQPAEAAEWKRSSLQQQAAWLTRFWDRRAAESGVRVSERLATHYRRLAVARQRFVRNSKRGTGGAGILLADEPVGTYPFDQRGVILVRHGPPVAVVTTQHRSVLPNETWVYEIPGIGAQLFHFVALNASSEYAIVSDISKALQPRQLINDRNDGLLQLLHDRVRFEPAYQTAAARLRSMFAREPSLPLTGPDVRGVLESFDTDYRRGARQALQMDSYRREYDGELDPLHDVFAFRTPFSRTELTAAVAIPARELVPQAGSAGTRYALGISVILLDTLQGTVTRADTTLIIDARRQLDLDEYLRTHVTLPVIPSEHVVYKLAVEDLSGGRGILVEGSRALRDFGSSERLLVSDIVLAMPDTAGDWQRGAQRLALALPRSFEPTRPFTVFYEVYNFAPGEAYSTRITVTPIEGGAGRRIKDLLGGSTKPIELRFDGVAAPDSAGVLQEVREVASDLPEGRYRLVVEVTARTSRRTAVTQTEFEVTK